MTPNPLLKKLGYSNSDRVVIIHTDDIGMCQASLQAFEDLWDFGTISSGAVMVPCPWFPATAEFCRTHPEVDLGVHATLNSEWDTYRWGPISTRDPRTGLIDKDGYFHQREPAFWQGAQLEAVVAEIDAQVERALAAGVDVTHIDSHMGAVIHPKFAGAYINAAVSRHLPVLAPRADSQGFEMLGVDDSNRAFFDEFLRGQEEQGLPLFDYLSGLPLEHDHDHIALAKQFFGSIPAGVSELIFHPSIDTPELRAIAPDWPARVANYKAFMSREIKDFIKNSGVQVIGYRKLRESIRQ